MSFLKDKLQRSEDLHRRRNQNCNLLDNFSPFGPLPHGFRKKNKNPFPGDLDRFSTTVGFIQEDQ